MGSDLSFCANLVRAILIIINILFGILGVVVFSIGIWAIVAESDFSFVTGNSIVSGAALLIVAGIVTIIICVVGILGAIFKARPLLAVYAVCVLIIVILEIVAGIVAFVFRGTLLDEIEDRFNDALSRYRVEMGGDRDDDINAAVDNIQDVFDCCGFNNASDWFRENRAAVEITQGFPGCPTCNITTDDDCAFFSSLDVNSTLPNLNFTTVMDGCSDVSTTTFTVFAYSVGAVGIVFGVLEVVGILFALFLCCCITSARKQEVV